MKFLKYFIIPMLLCSMAKGQEMSADSVLRLLHAQLEVGGFKYKQIREVCEDTDKPETSSALSWNTEIHFHSEKLYDFDFLIDIADGGSLRYRHAALETTDADGRVEVSNGVSGLEDIKYLSALYNSVLTLRNGIPLILKAEGVSKAIHVVQLDGQEVYEICLHLGKRRIKNLGDDFDQMETEYDFSYYVYVDKQQQLPLKIVQKFGTSEIRTTFENLVNI